MSNSRKTMSKLGRVLLGISGLIPLLAVLGSPPDVMLLIYSLYVLAVFLRPSLVPLVRRLSLRPSARFALLVVASGLVAECLAWTTCYLARNEEPALLHPQLIPDLILGIGFYGGWALAWTLSLRRYRFSLTQVFVTAGLFGIPVEQDGQVLVSALKAGPLGVFLLAYVFVVYGSIVGLAYLMVEDDLRREGQCDRWFKYPLVLLLMLVCAWVLTAAVMLVATPLGLIPEPRPIWEHPFF